MFLFYSILFSQAVGHTLMQNPIPFPGQLNDNAPMAIDGSDWPCSGETVYDPEGIMNVWEHGSTQHLQAMGGSTHGGGSCQISVTYDNPPKKWSQWRVIHSIQGGCPIRNMIGENFAPYGVASTTTLPSIFNFTIPDWLPVGRAVMAWTWYGRWSVPEMFMNCAPIMVLGGPTPTDVHSSVLREQWAKAPLMFEANNGNGCWTQNKGSCVQFPEPGDSLEINHECPIDPEIMFTGKCGPEIRLATVNIPQNKPASLTDHDVGGASLTDHDVGGASLTDHDVGGASLTDHDVGGASLRHPHIMLESTNATRWENPSGYSLVEIFLILLFVIFVLLGMSLLRVIVRGRCIHAYKSTPNWIHSSCT